MSKALLIKSYETKQTGNLGQWNDFNNATSYIQGIQTGNILDNLTADKIAGLISGVPTPWARAKLFKFAFDTLAQPKQNQNSGLTQVYQTLHDEWRGLIALLALFSDRIRFSEPVSMDMRKGQYDIAPAFGRMLFNDRDLWSNQDDLAKNPDAQPFIQLIYYRDQLIGATSPLSGCFTGVLYSGLQGMNDIPWYRNGKLEDPMRYLDPKQVQKLYLFVRNMNSHLQDFETKINSCRANNRVELTGFMTISRAWEKEIEKVGGDKLHDKGPVARYENLECPFSVLFESNVPVYLNKSNYTFSYIRPSGVDCIELRDIQDLMSRDKYVIGWTEDKNEPVKLSEANVYFLRVNDVKHGNTYYFSVPLSELGIDIFKNSLGSLLDYSTLQSNARMTASINGDKLSVGMTVTIDGEEVMLNTRDYEIDWLTCQGRVIMWPNFVSDNWNRYYLYSEYIAGDKEGFLPLFNSGGEILRDPLNAFYTPAYTKRPSDQIPVRIDKLIEYPAGIGDGCPRYNILMADKPFAGLLAMVNHSNPERAGYLMVRHDKVTDLTQLDAIQDAKIGIDFGSNNTCLYYNNGTDIKPIEFENNRAVLVGAEHIDTHAIAGIDELLFFTNYPAQNGQLKSWLHEHDTRYNKNREAEEVAGGVPVNRPNVMVRAMDKHEITTQAGKLHYNMKWLDGEKGVNKKGAYLKSVWLQACAFLYKNRIRPTEIAWSHPGAMTEADVTDLERIFQKMKSVTPFNNRLTLNNDLPTEAEAVASYALSQDFGLTNNNMFLGIDVGGSTSDIMLIAKNLKDRNAASLYRESSVRLASGVFFDAIIRSELFRDALFRYHESNQRSVYVNDIKGLKDDPDKAPYYLNSIFDQLRTADDYNRFYDSLYGSDAKFAFTIPAYVSGLLLYYSGMLVGKTIKDHALTNVNQIDVLPFGKGGRIFHWLLSSLNSLTLRYYEDCLNAGIQVVAKDIKLNIKYRDEIRDDNKAEVAMGLCNPKEIVKLQTAGNSDICGETGVKFVNEDCSERSIAVDEELTGDYFDNEMNNFNFTDNACFNGFMDIFIDFVARKARIYPNAEKELRKQLDDLKNRIQPACRKDSEYIKAKQQRNTQKTFAYHQPIIIAEGVAFLDTLISMAFNQ